MTSVYLIRTEDDHKAALALYSERGFDQTTASQIAARAGLTERTFFRHFTDKREVLFGGSALLQERIVAGVAAAPPLAGPLDAVACGLAVGAAMVGEFRRDVAVHRRKPVAEGNAGLQVERHRGRRQLSGVIDRQRADAAGKLRHRRQGRQAAVVGAQVNAR